MPMNSPEYWSASVARQRAQGEDRYLRTVSVLSVQNWAIINSEFLEYISFSFFLLLNSPYFGSNCLSLYCVCQTQTETGLQQILNCVGLFLSIFKLSHFIATFLNIIWSIVSLNENPNCMQMSFLQVYIFKMFSLLPIPQL